MTNGFSHPGVSSIPRTRPVAPFAVVAELSVLYEIASLGFANSEEQLGREAAEKASRLFGARYFALLRGPLLQQTPVVVWGVRDENELKTHLMRPGPNQFRFSFPLSGDEVATVFAEQSRPVDEHETRLYTILARRIQTAMTAIRITAEKEQALEAVRRNEHRLQSIIRSMTDALAVTDTHGYIELLNPAAEKLTGWTYGEAQGKRAEEVFRFLEEQTREPVENPVTRVLREGGRVEREGVMRLVARDKTEWFVSVSAVPIHDEYDATIGIVLLLSDQTQARKTECELRDALQRAECYLQAAGVIMLVLNREGAIVLLNRKGEEVLGVSAHEVRGADWFERFLPESIRAETRRYFDDLMSGRVAVHDICHENKIMLPDGSERLIFWQNTILRDEHGQPYGVLSSGTDVTAERAAQSKIQEQLEELRRWYKVTLGREETVLKLKREINDLCQKVGEPPRYETTA